MAHEAGSAVACRGQWPRKCSGSAVTSADTSNVKRIRTVWGVLRHLVRLGVTNNVHQLQKCVDDRALSRSVGVGVEVTGLQAKCPVVGQVIDCGKVRLDWTCVPPGNLWQCIWIEMCLFLMLHRSFLPWVVFGHQNNKIAGFDTYGERSLILNIQELSSSRSDGTR